MKINRSFLCASISLLTLISISLPCPSGADSLDRWHGRNPLPYGNPLYAVAYGNGLFVAAGSFGTILTSPDGMTWTQRVYETTDDLLGVAYGNHTFVAVGSSGRIVTSPNGAIWTVRARGTYYY